jgi:hypothetical protein
MIRRSGLAAFSAFVLLGSSIGAVSAHDGFPTPTMHPTVNPSGSMAVVTRYFNALNHRGLPGHDYGALRRLYTSDVVLTESVTTGRPQIHAGPRQVRTFDGWNQVWWIVVRSEQLSPGVVLTIERPYVRGKGHELSRAAPWLTLFTLRNERIANLLWMPS